MLGDVNKLFVLKQTFPPIIWIFIEGEGDGIESRLPFKIFSTLLLGMYNFVTIISWSDESQLLWESFARDRSESAFHALRKLRDLTIMEPCWLSHFFRVTILDFNLSFLFFASKCDGNIWYHILYTSKLSNMQPSGKKSFQDFTTFFLLSKLLLKYRRS